MGISYFLLLNILQISNRDIPYHSENQFKHEILSFAILLIYLKYKQFSSITLSMFWVVFLFDIFTTHIKMKRGLTDEKI
ncbi:Uncharacterised protein [uncultured Clostridium sp.]|nr:Uncharacterised protein [uncultured Clostridium sp.]